MNTQTRTHSITRHLPDELCRLNEDVLCRTAFDIANTTSVHGPDPSVWPGTNLRPWAPWPDRHLEILLMCVVVWMHLINQWSVDERHFSMNEKFRHISTAPALISFGNYFEERETILRRNQFSISCHVCCLSTRKWCSADAMMKTNFNFLWKHCVDIWLMDAKPLAVDIIHIHKFVFSCRLRGLLKLSFVSR